MRVSIAAIFWLAAVAAASNDTTPFFRRFYPTYNAAFQRILRENCTDILQYYYGSETDGTSLGEVPPPVTNDGRIDLDNGFGFDKATNYIAECMLNATPEMIKSKMATAQVLLGLMPSLLTLLGPGLHQTGLIAVAAGHPPLAFLLAAGSPAVSVLQSLDYTKGVHALSSHRLTTPAAFRSFGAFIVVFEYLLALGSIANVVEASFRIFEQVIFSFRPGSEWTIFLWSFIGLIIHLLGAVAVAFRVQVVSEPGQQTTLSAKILAYMRLFRRPKDLHIKILPESFAFHVVTWIAAVMTVSHIFFGSLVFSSVLFISVEDGAFILVRMMFSVVVCKLIIMYELSYLQGVITIVDAERKDYDTDTLVSLDYSPYKPSIHRTPWRRI